MPQLSAPAISFLCTRVVVALATGQLIGCVSEVTPADVPGSLPSALLVCPMQAAAGQPFTVDGSASADLDGPFASVVLRLDPGGTEVADLVGTFTVADPGVATVALRVIDGDGNAAEARCRVMVVGPGVDPGDPEEPADPTEPTEPSDPGEPGDPYEPPPGAGTPVDVTGSFALVAWDSVEMNGGILDPARQCGATAHLGLVELSQQGSRVSMTLRTCALVPPTVQAGFSVLHNVTLPDAFVDSLQALGPIDVELGAAVVGATFAPALDELGRARVVGAALASDDEALPTNQFDQRVRDDDDDGWPGISIFGSMGAQSIAYRRSIRAFSGVVMSDNEIAGSAPGSYRVDSDAGLFALLAVLMPSGTGLPSTFRMVRIDGAHGAEDLRGADAAADCSDLRAFRDQLMQTLLPPAPPADCPSY